MKARNDRRSTLARTVSCAGALALVATLGAACGPADKQAAVRAVKAATRRSEIRLGTLELSSAPEKLPTAGTPAAAGAAALPGLAGGANPFAAPPAPVQLGLVVDVAHHRAALIAPAAVAARVGVASPTGGAPALVIFDGAVTYVRRPTLGVVGARPWYRLDTSLLKNITEPDVEAMLAPRTGGDLAVLSPITLLEEGSGLLTGSVKRVGDEPHTTPSGATEPASRIDANVSLEKTTRAFRRDADARRDTQLLLQAFAAHDDINPSRTWLTADQRLARFDVTYRSRPDRGVRIGVRYDLSFEPVGATPPVEADLLALPTSAETVGVSTLAQLRSALAQWLTPATTAATPAVTAALPATPGPGA